METKVKTPEEVKIEEKKGEAAAYTKEPVSGKVAQESKRAETERKEDAEKKTAKKE